MISQFLNPTVIAVIGAAREENKIGNIIFKNLVSNPHLKVFPVNPNADKILGKKCFKDVLEIPYNIDLAVICVKAEIAPKILEQISRKNIKNAIIIAAGFSESKNYELENKIKQIAEDNQIQILGPNVMGLISVNNKINASFFNGIPKPGSIAFLSQSGALGSAILDYAIKNEIGLSGFVSLGNMINTDFSDFIEYYNKDPETKVIAVYLESLKQEKGKRFIEVCKNSSKPIIILKAGSSEKGIRAAVSHTAALASEQGVYEGIFKQCNLIQTSSLRELFDISDTCQKLNNIKTKLERACIITNAGGPGVLLVDYLEKNKIQVPEIPKKTFSKLNSILSSQWSHNNPIDIAGDALADRYYNALKILETEDWFDFFIVILTPQYMTQVIETANLLINLKKPVFACFMGGKQVELGIHFLKRKNIPVFNELSDLADVLGKIKR